MFKQDSEKTGPGFRFYISGLNQQIDKRDLGGFFGNLVSAEITDVVVFQQKGFGFIEFDTLSRHEESKLLGRHVICGKTVECERARGREGVSVQWWHEVSMRVFFFFF